MEGNKFYLTKEGFERFKNEFGQLKKVRTLKMKEETPMVSAPHGVDSEYLTFQEDLELLESRIEELEEILKNYELIKPPPVVQRKVVQIGATVRVEVDGRIDEFTIVGSLEANPSVGRISNESPVGKALLGQRANDEVFISSPIKVCYKIKRIKYELL